MPQQPFARDSATPSFTLALTREVLRSIYSEAVLQRATPVRLETDKHPFDGNDELMHFPDRSECAPPLSTCHGTAADDLSHVEIAELHAARLDPFATADDGSTHVGHPKLSIARMTGAARFAAIFEKADTATFFVSPQAVTMLALPDNKKRAAFADLFPDILQKTAKVLSYRGVHLDGIAVAVLPDLQAALSSRGRADFSDKIDRLIAEGKSIIVLATNRNDLPTTDKMICNTVIALPLITGDMIIEILHQTHSVTGQVSDAAIRDHLPSDTSLQDLSLPLLKSAFFEPTTLTVAERLRVLSGRLKAQHEARTLTLDAIYLPPKANDDMQHLLSDLALWQTGDINWS